MVIKLMENGKMSIIRPIFKCYTFSIDYENNECFENY